MCSSEGPKQKGKRKRSDKEMEEMKKRKEENKVQKGKFLAFDNACSDWLKILWRFFHQLYFYES